MDDTDQTALVPPDTTTSAPAGGPSMPNAANAAQPASQQPGMTAPPAAAGPPQPPPSPQKSELMSIIHAVGNALGGGATRTEVDPKTGIPTQVNRSTGSKVGSAISTIARGAAAGLGAAPGPGFVGRAAAAGMQEQAGFQKNQFQQTQEQEEAGRAQAETQRQKMLTQASLAKSNQDIARTALEMKMNERAMDEHQVAIANSLQAIANVPGAIKLAHFNSNDDINNHLATVGADLSKKYAVDMAKNEIRLAPSPQGGFDAYQLPKDWHNQPVAEGTTVHAISYGADPKTGKPVAKMTEHPAPPGMNWGDQQQWEGEQYKTLASFNAAQTEQEKNKAQTAEALANTAKTQTETQQMKAFGVPVSPNFTPDPQAFTKSPQDLQKSLADKGQSVPPDFQTLYAIGHYDGKLTDNYSARPYNRPGVPLQKSTSQATQFIRTFINPQFDENQYGEMQNMEKEYGSTRANTAGGNAIAFNTATRHLGSLYDAAVALKNGNIPLLNSIVNQISQQAGSNVKPNFDSIKSALVGELGKTFKGGAPDIPERQELEKTISSSGSPDQLLNSGVIQTYAKLMQSKVDALDNHYFAIKGRHPAGLVDPEAANVMQKLSTPPGMTHIVLGPDGKNHYTNAQGTVDGGIAP